MTAKAESASSQTVMAYDAANRLVAITPASPAAGAVFTLDALGRFRTRVLSPGGTDTYSYLGSSETVAEVSNSATGTTRSLLDAEGSRLAVKAGAGAASFTLFDQLGSLAGLVDGARTITGAYRFDGYGEQVAAAGATSPWRFRGNLDISPSADALYDMGARFYAPSLGAFTQVDAVAGSAADPASMNRFLYAEASPATLIDPTGHDACTGAECDNPTYDNGKEGFDYCVDNCGASKTKYGPGDKGYKPYKPPAKPPVKPPAEPAPGVPLTVTSSMLDALTAGQLRAYVDARAAACKWAPANMPGCQDYGYAWCRQGNDRQACLQWVDLKDWGDLDGPLGTFVVAPASAILVSLGWAALVSVAGPAKDELPSAANQTMQLTSDELEVVQGLLSDPNKMHKIFDNAGHGLEQLTSTFGGRQGLTEQVAAAVRGVQGDAAGVFRATVDIGGTAVVVQGRVMNGVVVIGDFWVPK